MGDAKELDHLEKTKSSCCLKKHEDIPNAIYKDTCHLYKMNQKCYHSRLSLIQYYRVKRLFDLIFSLGALALLWPLFIGIGIAIKLDSKGPIFYKHKRVGKGGSNIELWKFRSMVIDADKKVAQFTSAQREEWERNFKLSEDPRITRVGRFLRKSSLDELPQLFNIVKGELSFVGPRPVVEQELKLYQNQKEKFLSVPPGLTGYWQAYARSTCSYDKRIKMEMFYVEHACLCLDARIFIATFAVVLKRQGAI